VKMTKENFIGKEALAEICATGKLLRRVGVELTGRRIAREGAILLRGDEKIGRITSGTFSPTLQKPIAMGYVKEEFKEPGTEIEVEIRGKREPAIVVKLPFYKR